MKKKTNTKAGSNGLGTRKTVGTRSSTHVDLL